MNEQADILQATHKLAFVGGMLIAACPVDEDISKYVDKEVPYDIAEAWYDEGKQEVLAALSNDYSDEHEILYYGSRNGFLPDGYLYAYAAE